MAPIVNGLRTLLALMVNVAAPEGELKISLNMSG